MVYIYSGNAKYKHDKTQTQNTFYNYSVLQDIWTLIIEDFKTMLWQFTWMGSDLGSR